MLTQEKVTNTAVKLALQCKQGTCSLGQALITLQSQSEQAAKNTVHKERGCLPPGSWINAYVEIRSKVNKEFWQTYRTMA